MPAENAATHRSPPKHPGYAPWGLRLTDADVAKLLKGIVATQMEEKWNITSTGPDEQGTIHTYLSRSWTGLEVYRLKIVGSSHGKQGHKSSGGAEIVEIRWDKDVEESVVDAKNTIQDLCVGLLGCEFKRPFVKR